MKSRLAFFAFLFSCSIFFAQTVAFEWITTDVFSGQGILQTAPIKIISTPWNLEINPDVYTPFEAYLVNADNGDSMTLTLQKSGRSTHKYSNRFKTKPFEVGFLRIIGNDKSWKAKVEQYMDLPDQWQNKKWHEQALKFQPYGSWTGEAEEKEINVDITEKSGKIVLEQKGPGRISIIVKDDKARIIGKWVSTQEGKTCTWFYEPGYYTISISAIMSSWTLNVESWAR